MANFFLDNKDLQFHLQHPLMRKIVALKERNYTLKDHHELLRRILRTRWTTTAACWRSPAKCAVR